MRIVSTTVQLVTLLALASGAAYAQGPNADPDRVLIVKTAEDPAIPSHPAACPFAANVFLGATVWSVQSEAAGAELINRDVRQVGTAAACVQITSLAPFATAPFYIEFALDEGTISAQGVCTVTSNNVPVPGLILAGCALNVVGAPAGIAGGNATSNSVFNPRGLPGFNTGSFWTIRLYKS